MGELIDILFFFKYFNCSLKIFYVDFKIFFEDFKI